MDNLITNPICKKKQIIIMKRENEHLKFDLHRDVRLGLHPNPGIDGLPLDVNLLENHETGKRKILEFQ